jgi:macrolide transport system ATP-binding/permease protein
MTWMRRAWLKFQTLFRRQRLVEELDDEIQFHLDEQIAENIAAGMNPEQARFAAMRSFGNETFLKEDTWEAWGWTRVEQLGQDLRFALRQLRKTPGFTATAVLTLALGIGANASIFTLVNAVMMKNLPVTDPDTLVRVGDNNNCCVNSGAGEDYALFSTEVYQRLRQNVPEFQELAAMQAGFGFRPVIARRDGSAETARSVMGEFVSGNYFRTFGLQPHAGRLFVDDDDRPGAPMVAVMSYETWRRDYAADSSIVGSTFWINTKPVTIAGIAPAGFYGDRLSSTPPDFYLPIESMPVLANVPYVHDRETDWLYILGRTKPGVQMPVLQQKVSTLVKQWLGETKTFSEHNNMTLLEKVRVVLTPGGAGIREMREEYESNLRLLMCAAGLVLLIACANIANLLLVRGMGRKVEMSVRTALGAKRARIVQQLLTESIVLAGFSGIAGLAVAVIGTRMLLALAFPHAQSLPIQASPSLPVLLFACGLSLLTGVLFGVAPAWIAANAEPMDALRSGSRTVATGASVLQRGLVVLQAALSLVLLVGAGLFSQSLNKLQGTDMKLDSKNRYIVHINPQAAGYTQMQLEALYRTMEQRFHELPGVVKVGISSYTPMEDNNQNTSVQVQGLPDPNLDASFIRVNADYFDSVGTKVLMGRGIGPQDTATAPTVCAVNQEFAKDLFPAGTNPIGHRFGPPGPESSGDCEIIGVVEDTTYTTVRWKNHRMFFLAMMQRPASSKEPIEDDTSLYAGAIVLQTAQPVNDMERLARETLASINPNLTVARFQTFDQQIADQFIEDRMVARLTTLFGIVALLLATIGLYGVTAYTVARRTSEIGIRMALGAARTQVIGMVMRSALTEMLIGLAIGLPVALLCVRFVKTQLYEVQGVDPGVMMVAILMLAIASALAGLIPARRAASTDPAQTLRTE